MAPRKKTHQKYGILKAQKVLVINEKTNSAS